MSEPMHNELCNAQCAKLAGILKERLVELAEVYAQHLERIGWYAAFSPQVRLDIANRDLEAMIAALEAGNTRQFVELISSQAAMRIEQDFNYFDFIEALAALEKVLLAAIQNIDEVGVAFVWQALSGAREVVFGLTAERFGTSEEQFREIVSRSMVGIFRMALDGEVLDANPAMLQVFELETVADLNEIGWENLCVNPDDYHHLLELVWDGPVSRFEVDMRTSLGEVVPVSISTRLVYDEEGYPQAIEGTLEDISDRRAAESALRRSEAYFRLLTANAQDIITVLDAGGIIRYSSDALVRITGQRSADVTGQLFIDLVHPEDVSAISKALETISQSPEQTISIAYRFRKANSTPESHDLPEDWVYLESIGTNLLDEPAVAGIVINSRDITQRRLLEAERQETYVRRASQVEITTEVAQEIAVAPAIDELFRQVVTLVKERFNYYHAQIFRYEPALNAVLLVIGYGKTGKDMLAAGHRLEMGRGVVGTAAATGDPVLAADVTQDPDWVPNPYLPDTKGELAVPIKWRDEVLGILDVQSDKAGALDTDDQIVLQGLCGQIATAIEATRLRQEMAVQLAELDTLYRTSSREAWDRYRQQGRLTTNYRFNGLTLETGADILAGLATPEITQSLSTASLTPPSSKEGAAVAPLLARGEIIGLLGVQEDVVETLESEDLSLLESVAEQVAQALENARLYQQSEQRTAEIRALFDAGLEIGAILDIKELLDKAAELALGLFNSPESTLVIQSPLTGKYYMGHSIISEERISGWGAGWEGAPRPGGMTERIIQAGESFLVRDNRTHAKSRRSLIEAGLLSQMGVPLRSGTQVLGAFFVNGAEVSQYDAHDMELLEFLGTLVASAAKNAFSFAQAQEALAETNLLYRVNAALSAAQDYEEILNVLREYTVLNKADLNVSINLFDRPWQVDKMPEWIEVMARWSNLPVSAVTDRYPTRAFAALSLLTPDEPLIIENLVTDPRLDDNSRKLYVEQYGAKSTLFVPLVVGGQFIGYFNAIYSDLHTFSETDIRLLVSLSQQSALAVQSIKRLADLAASESHFRQMVSRSQVGIFTTTLEGQFLEANPVLLQTLGFESIAALNAAGMDNLYIDINSRQEMIDKLKQGPVTGFETQWKHHDGHSVAVSMSVNTYYDDILDKQILEGTLEDITERKRAEVAVRESQQRFQGLVETLIDWIWEIDVEGLYTYVSPQVEDLLGYEPEEVIGKAIFEFASPEDVTRVKSELEALMAQKLPVMGMQGEYVRQDGYVVVFESNAQPFWADDGTFLGYRGTHRDVTDRREVEKEREKLLKDLESRASQLQTAAEVGQAATSVLDLEELLPLAVNLILERFDYYYVGAFMVDDSGQWAVLRAGTGAAGEKMLASGHHLAVGGDSMIGACIQSGEARLAFDVGEEAIRFDNPVLPETRSEMALPLIGHGESLGALTIQSSRPADFSSADIIVLQTMADQLANAIYNVTLLQQREEAFKEIERAYGSYTRESWRSYLERSRGAMGFRYRNLGVETATALHPEATSALHSGQRVVARAGDWEVGAAGGTLAVPIQLRGQTLGVLNLRFEEEDVPSDIVELVEDVANRLGLALDSARLLEQTRISAAREQLISEATSRMRETLDMEAVLKTAAQEVRNALGVPEVVIRLGLDEISTYKPGGLDDL